jgi:hypothetical protein
MPDEKELVLVAAELLEDYYALRAAVIRGRVAGRRVGARWFVSVSSARRWSADRAAERGAGTGVGAA